MRIRLSVLAAVAAFLPSAPAQAQADPPTYHICQLYEASGAKLLAITEPFPYQPLDDRGMSTLNDGWQDYLYALKRGRASLPFDVSKVTGGSCQAGTTDPAEAAQVVARYQSRHPGVHLFPAPFDIRGKIARSRSPAPAAKTAAKPAPKADEGEARVQQSAAKKAEYERKLAEHQRQLAEREAAIAEAAAKHAANKAAAEAQVARHAKELAEHRDQVTENARAAAQLRAEYAMRAAGLEPTKPDEERVEFKEGVVLCSQPNPESKSFSCQGPLQNVSTPLDAAGTSVALGQACGSDRSIRDLGMVKGYRAFGCGFGIHPTARDYPGNTDVAAKLGIDFVPGRGSYFCPKSKLAYCR